ncbi:hypothetical protein J2847_005875 [Azospirillum agricola]|uniref:hypothetical protein n=1 Tax=Azospirillum agricola TaxID=1720247 RepID=UPI001AE2C622|nr:hypothetical protein [Azospirillum agricola]MBP2232546.1 hypothetical protein [Azospirillum agricola]
MTDINADVIGRDDLTDAIFHITTPAGLLLVNGCVYRDFGLHPHRCAIVLTHLPTGEALGTFGDIADAYVAMGDASRCGWGRA